MTKSGLATSNVSDEHKFNCRSVADRLIDYVTGGLRGELAKKFKEHMRDCPDCVAFLNTYRKTIQATRSLGYQVIPKEALERLHRMLRMKSDRSSKDA